MGKLLEGKTALVTGASRGSGEYIARRFAAEGATVVITARTVDAGKGTLFHDGHAVKVPGSLKEVAAQIKADGGKAIAIQMDLADPASRAKAVKQALAEVGHIDILVNNAARGAAGGVTWANFTPEESHEMWQTNVQAPFDLMQRLIPPMIERGRGWVINIGSHAAETERPQRPYSPYLKHPAVFYYSPTKEMMEALSTQIAIRVDGTGVSVNDFAPTNPFLSAGLIAAGGEAFAAMPGIFFEPMETMAECALAFAISDPNEVNGVHTESANYLLQIGREVHTLDGKSVFPGWKPPGGSFKPNVKLDAKLAKTVAAKVGANF